MMLKNSGIEWIGEIPDGWEVKRNKELFYEVSDRVEGTTENVLLSVSEYYGVEPRSEKIDSNEVLMRSESLDGYKICKIDDLVMNIMLAWKSSLGISKYDGVVSPSYAVFRMRKTINSRYFHYLYRTDLYANCFKKNSTGIIDSRLRLYPEKFLALYSHFPSIPTQEKIAGYLDKKCGEIDRLIENENKQIEKLKEYKQSVITHAVTKGLNPSAKLKPSGIDWLGDIPEEWEFGELKNYCVCNTECLSEKESEDFNIYYIDISSVNNCGEISNIQNFIFKEAPSRARRIIKENDIIISTVRTYLKAIARVTKEYDGYICSTGFAVLTPNNNINSRFLYYALFTNTFTSRVEMYSNGISYPAINSSTLISIPIIIPIDMQEQQTIVDYLDKKCAEIDRLITIKQEKIEKLNEYKKSIIYEYVTGKKEVI